MRKILVLLSFGFISASAQHQPQADTLHSDKTKLKHLILPAALVTYGLIGLEDNAIRDFNHDVRNFLAGRFEHSSVDDVTIFVPAAAVYGLNAVGIKGKHNFRERTVIFATASTVMYSAVSLIKTSTNVRRPDGSTSDSFPSGHTATAFAGAELLREEYGDSSPWYGITGYVIAAGAGFMRIANDRHWLTDVAAGAGIGILSTRLAYWVFPLVNDFLFSKKQDGTKTSLLLPYSDGRSHGFVFVIALH
ncbi:MAG TPA: phosphatase PAP2 family protein [Flavobacterium sp.]|jgi:membrane-associated phospholipid phosphatase